MIELACGVSININSFKCWHAHGQFLLPGQNYTQEKSLQAYKSLKHKL